MIGSIREWQMRYGMMGSGARHSTRALHLLRPVGQSRRRRCSALTALRRSGAAAHISVRGQSPPEEVGDDTYVSLLIVVFESYHAPRMIGIRCYQGRDREKIHSILSSSI